MDILCEPDDPYTTTSRCPYLCIEQWDGGDFRTFAQRKGKMSLVPDHLRLHSSALASDGPYLEGLYPSKSKELEPFLQTWLFFGLASEFLGYNKGSQSGSQFQDSAEALVQISKLHALCIAEELHGGSKYLISSPIIDMVREDAARRISLKSAPSMERLQYLGECVKFASFLLNSIQENLGHTTRCAIAGLGEVLTIGLHRVVNLAYPGLMLASTGCTNWYAGYLKPGQEIDSRMLQQGWCPSMIEKIRTQSHGLLTMHYISQLKLYGNKKDHSRCNPTSCQAFQIDFEAYQPSHTNLNCQCGSVYEIDESVLGDILKRTDSFPVLRIQRPAGGTDKNVQLIPETWRPGMPYVALSHVWADGLGNPQKTGISRCQVSRLAYLLKSLEGNVKNDTREDSENVPYYLWLDTLCCPINLELKMIALQRIADVYRQATRVLVLDSSLTSIQSESCHPAELILRLFNLSPWVRRLWTLQEGVLTDNLWIQFEDAAVECHVLLMNLFGVADSDTRYLRIFQDALTEYGQFNSMHPKDEKADEAASQHQVQRLTMLQRALHFRTVSVPSDEPLCVSTLLGLDTSYIAIPPHMDERMSRVWELIARKNSNKVPVRIIFYLEDHIDIPGWRWAPRSFLSSSMTDPWLTIDERVSRFVYDTVEHQEGSKPSKFGSPTDIGLHVRLEASILTSVPRLSGMPLHPWSELINPTEDGILLRNEKGQWLRIIDHYRSRKIATWTHDEQRAYDRLVDGPLCQSVDTGKCILLYDPSSASHLSYQVCCLAQLENFGQNSGDVSIERVVAASAIKVRLGRNVILTRLSDAESLLMDILEKLSDDVAQDTIAKALLEIKDRGSTEFQDMSQRVKQLIRDKVQLAWNEDPRLKQAVEDHIGMNMDDYIWALIPKNFSHKIFLRSVPEVKRWIVD